MRKVLLGVLAAGAVWYLAIGGRELKEAHIYEAYNTYWSAFHDNNSEAACALFDPAYSAKIRTRTPAGSVEESADQAAACAGVAKFHALKQQMEASTGQTLYFNSEFNVERIDITPDRKLARAQVRTEIRIGTEQRLFLKITEQRTDVFARSLGKTRITASDGMVSMF